MTRGRLAGLIVGALSVGAAVAFPAAAAADPLPPPPVEPGLAPAAPPSPAPAVPVIGMPLGPNGLAVLAQTGAPEAGPLGMPPVTGLDSSTVLGQNLVPSVPGGGPGISPSLNVFNNAYGLPQNEVPSAPGQGTQFDVAPGQENSDVSRREWLGRYVDMYRDGRLRGGLLGQSPQEQLGQPLPGTAPPPGTNIPPGLVQFLPEPPPPPGELPPPPG